MHFGSRRKAKIWVERKTSQTVFEGCVVFPEGYAGHPWLRLPPEPSPEANEHAGLPFVLDITKYH